MQDQILPVIMLECAVVAVTVASATRETKPLQFSYTRRARCNAQLIRSVLQLARINAAASSVIQQNQVTVPVVLLALANELEMN